MKISTLAAIGLVWVAAHGGCGKNSGNQMGSGTFALDSNQLPAIQVTKAKLKKTDWTRGAVSFELTNFTMTRLEDLDVIIGVVNRANGESAIITRPFIEQVPPASCPEQGCEACQQCDSSAGACVPLPEEGLCASRPPLAACIPSTSQSGVQVCYLATENSCDPAGTGCFFDAPVIGTQILTTLPVDPTTPTTIEYVVSYGPIFELFPMKGLLGECPVLQLSSATTSIHYLLHYTPADVTTPATISYGIQVDHSDWQLSHDLDILDPNYLSCQAYLGAGLDGLTPLIVPLLVSGPEAELLGAICVACSDGTACADGFVCTGGLCQSASGTDMCQALPLNL